MLWRCLGPTSDGVEPAALWANTEPARAQHLAGPQVCQGEAFMSLVEPNQERFAATASAYNSVAGQKPPPRLGRGEPGEPTCVSPALSLPAPGLCMGQSSLHSVLLHDYCSALPGPSASCNAATFHVTSAQRGCGFPFRGSWGHQHARVGGHMLRSTLRLLFGGCKSSQAVTSWQSCSGGIIWQSFMLHLQQREFKQGLKFKD